MSSNAEPRSAIVRRQLLFGFLLPVSVYLLSLLLVRPFGDFPLNDDWVYARDVLMTIRQGGVWVTGFESAWGLMNTTVGVFISALFGFSHAHLRWLGVASAIGSAGILFLFLRKRTNSTWLTSISLFSFLFFAPGYIVSLSFMTDMPFVFLWLLTAYLWEEAVNRQSLPWLMIGLLVCILSMAQRQFGLFLPFSLGLIVVFSSTVLSRQFRLAAAVAVLLSGAAYLGLSLYWRTLTLAPSAPIIAKVSIPRIVMNFHSSLIFFAILVAPLTLFLGESSSNKLRFMSARKRILVKGFLAIFLLATAVRFLIDPMSPFFSNQISIYGLFNHDEVLFGQRPVIFGWWIKLAIVAVAFLSLFRSLVWLMSLENLRLKSRSWKSAAILPVASLIYFLFSALRAALFDRYLVPVFPAVIILFASRSPSLLVRNKVFSVFLLGMFVTFATSISHDYFRWSEAKWSAANQAVRFVSPLLVGGGYEWHGWNGGRTSHPDQNISGYAYVVSFSELPDTVLVGKIPWTSFWSPRKRQILLLRNTNFSGKTGD